MASAFALGEFCQNAPRRRNDGTFPALPAHVVEAVCSAVQRSPCSSRSAQSEVGRRSAVMVEGMCGGEGAPALNSMKYYHVDDVGDVFMGRLPIEIVLPPEIPTHP